VCAEVLGGFLIVIGVAFIFVALAFITKNMRLLAAARGWTRVDWA